MFLTRGFASVASSTPSIEIRLQILSLKRHHRKLAIRYGVRQQLLPLRTRKSADLVFSLTPNKQE